MPNPYDDIYSGAQTSAPAGNVTDNPYDDVYAEQQRQQTAALRANAQAATGTNPDTYAKAAQTGRVLGIPTAAVTPAPVVPTRVANGLMVDQNTQGAPVARQAYTNPAFANVAHDDSHNVGLLDRFLSAVGSTGGPYVLSRATDAIGGLFGYKPGELQAAAGGAAARGFSTIESGISQIGDMVGQSGSFKAIAAVNPSLAALAVGLMARSQNAPIKSYLDNTAQDLENRVTTQGHLADIARLVGGLAPYLASGEAAPLVMGLSGMGETAEAAKAAGTYGSTSSNLASVANGALQAALGKFIGGDQISGLAGKLLPDAFTSTIGRSIATGLASRVLGSGALGAGMALGSNAITKGLIDPNQSLTEGVGDSAEQMILLDLGMHALHTTGAAIGARIGQAAQGESDGHILDGINMLAEASKVHDRAPDVWHSYLQDVTDTHGAPDSVYVSQDAFTKAFSTPEGQTALEKMPEAVRDAAQIAATTGGDIKVPTADFGTHVAGSPLYDELADHIKFDPNSFTRSEAQEVLQTEGPRVLAELDAAVKSKQSTDAFSQSRDVVEGQIKDQLTAIGRFSPAVNAINAKLGAYSIATHAARLGMTPEAFHAEHGFSIGNGDVQTGSQALEQGNKRTDTPEFKNWFGESKVIDDQGKPLTVYHGTNQSIESFRADKGGRATGKNAGATLGHFFTSDPEVAARYADNAGRRLVPNEDDHQAESDRLKKEAGRLEKEAARTGQWDAYERAMERWEAHEIDATRAPDAGQNIVPVRLAINNPFVRDYAGEGIGSSGDFERQIEKAKADGHDGLILRNLNDTPDNASHPADHYIAFDPTQIKSVNNRGTFDPNDPRMLHQAGGARGEYIPDTNTLNLLKNANLSTFIHELGHFHLEALSKFAGSDEATANDFSSVLKWFDPDMTPDKWAAMGFEDRRPYHEQFAQGFEQYLLEGKAPSQDLRGVFQRMSAWMKNVYRSITGLGTELTPEVRGVMDRLVATPDEIQAAERQMNYKPAFDAKPEFMSDDQWAAYQSLGLKATMDAVEKLGTRTVKDLQWVEGAKSKALKKLQAEHKAIRDNVRDEVTKTVMSQPVERAREFLKFGRVDGEKVTGPHKLDIDQVAKALGFNKDDTRQRSLGFDKKGPSLIEWISKRGGIWDGDPTKKTGGDFKAMGLGDWHNQKPFRKKAIRDVAEGPGKNGADYILQQAIEAGYFPELDGKSQESYSDLHDSDVLHDAINAELGGRPRYAGIGEVDPNAPARGEHADHEFFMGQIEDAAEKHFGIEKGTLDPDFLEYAARLKVDNSDASQAFMDAVNDYAVAETREVYDEELQAANAGDDSQAQGSSDQSEPVGDNQAPGDSGSLVAGRNETDVKQSLGYGKYGVLGKDGLDPELVAEAHGYSSARSMLHDLVTSEKAKDKIHDLTDETMLERYGDLSNPQNMSEAALEAIHNDARGKLLATEFTALERALGRKSDLASAAKKMAEQIVGDMKVGDLKANRFRAEQNKAGEKADRALRENNLEEAAAQKRAQLLNFHLAKAIDEAKDLAAKQVTNLKSYDKKSVRDRVGTDIALIDQLLDQYDLKVKATQTETVLRTALTDWFHSAVDGGMEPHIDERLLNAVQKTPYRDLTTSMFTGLHDTVDSIARIARSNNTIAADGKRMAVEKAVSQLGEKLDERGEHFTKAELVEPPKLGVDPWLPVALHRFQSFMMSTFRGSLLGQDFKSNRYDMHQIQGAFEKHVFGRLTEQNYFKIDLTSKVSRAFAEKAKELGKDWQGSMNDIVPNSDLIDPSTGEPLKMTRSKMLRMATHVGNESNFKKMSEGWGWDQDKVWDFLRSNMSAKDWDASQFVMDQFEPIFKMSQDMIKRLGGVLPEKVEARSFTVDTPDGQTITLRGGYSPIDYDPLRSKLAQRLAASEMAPTQAIDPAQRNYKATTTSNGGLRSRVEGYTDVVNLDFNAVSKNLRDSIHDLAYREALIDIGKIMKDETFRTKFMLSYGREEYIALQKLMDNIRDLNQRDDAMTSAEKAFQYTRQGVVITGIGYRLSTVGKHGTSAALKSLGYSAGGGQGYFLSRVARLATGNAGGDIAEARAKFPEIRARLLQMDRDYRVKEKAMLEGETLLQKNERYGHALVAWSDALSATATAHAAYDWAVTEGIPVKLGGTGAPMDHDAAVKYADKIVREAHGSALETSRANFMHERGVSSLLGMIYGFQNNTLGQMLDGADKMKLGKGTGITNAARLMATFLVPAVATMAISHGGASDQEGWSGWTAEAIAGELASTVPIVRDAWKAIEGQIRYGKLDFSPTPINQVMSNVLNIPFDIKKELGGNDSRIIQHAFDSLGQVGHIAGMGQLGHMVQYQRDVHNYKVSPDGWGDYTKHLLLGGTSKRQ